MNDRGTFHNPYPLPANYFPKFTPTDNELYQYQYAVDNIRKETISTLKWGMHNEDSALGWRLSSSKKHYRETGIRTYCRKIEGNGHESERRLEFKCMGKVSVSLDGIMETLYSDNTSQFRSKSHFLLENCLDAAVLHVMKQKTEELPYEYVGLNWLATKCSGMFAKKRATCYIRSTGTTLDNTQTRVGYVVHHSIERSEFDPLESALGLIRTIISAVFCFKENHDSPTTSVMWQGSINLSGFSSSKALAYVHEYFSSVIVNLNKYLDLINMEDRKSMDRRKWVPNNDRKRCFLCKKKFSLLRGRHHCRLCGEVMCKDCEVARHISPIELQELEKRYSRKAIEKRESTIRRYCKKCIGQERLKQQNEKSQHSAKYPQELSPHGITFEGLSHWDISTMYGDATHKRSKSDVPAMIYTPSSTSQCSFSYQQTPEFRGRSKTKSDNLHTPVNWSQYEGNNKYSRNTYHAGVKTQLYDETLFRGVSFSSSNISESPLEFSINEGEDDALKFRQRLETDPMESYDNFSGTTKTVDNQNETMRELANRLWEISNMAKETLDHTKRNSSLMSDTSSCHGGRSSEQFQNLDKNIAEQADILNYIGMKRTGKVYMENDPSEPGGVRASLTSISGISDSERFELVE